MSVFTEKVRSVAIAVLLSFAVATPLAALERVISPVTGSWANRQSLVLNVRDGAECFYSYSGTDPLVSGFMYDGPVLIDADGEVTVRIVCVLGGNREEYQVTYTVDDDGTAFADGSIEQNFIDTLASRPLYPVAAGQTLTIPQSLLYCFGDGEQPFIPGMALSVSAENRLARYVPCTVTTDARGEGRRWRFVVFLTGGDAGTLAKQDAPFELQNWTTFIWKDRKQIFSIDDGEWSASASPLLLDRSVSHRIAWQSVAYEKGNPVRTFVLPPKPELEVRSASDRKGPVIFSIQGDARYRMEIVASGNATDAPASGGLFTQAAFDTFVGDYIGGTAVFACYCDGVYQGELGAPYIIDNKPPLPPVIVSTAASGDYARKPVELSFTAEEGASLYYAVSSAQEVGEDADMAALAASADVGGFRPYEGGGITLSSDMQTALFYKVCAYAVDSAGNMSATSDYTVIIDEYNYYLTEGAAAGGDGSRSRPFASFEQALRVVRDGRFANFYVTGTIMLGAGEHAVTSNCAFTSLGNARFVLPPDASIVVRSASLAAKGCVFEKESDSARQRKSNGVLFRLESAAVSFDGCEVVGVFDENGTAFSASGSVIDFERTGLTVQGDVYACGVSASDSKITSRDSRFTAVAPTAVNFSVQGGLFELRSSDCRVVSHLGRIAELSRTNARITGNNYMGEFDTKTVRVSAVWKDERTLLLENENNSSVGF